MSSPRAAELEAVGLEMHLHSESDRTGANDYFTSFWLAETEELTQLHEPWSLLEWG